MTTQELAQAGGQRMGIGMDEVGLYSVKGGKIVKVSFFFGSVG